MIPAGTERGKRRRAFRQRLFCLFLCAMLVGYAKQVLTAPTVGQDFKAFSAAAILVGRGGDPYSWSQLAPLESALYNAPAHLHPGDASFYDFQPYPEGPWLALVLQPFNGLPWQAGYALFAMVMSLTLLSGALLIFAALGWPRSRLRLAGLCVLLSPIAFLCIFQGQITPLVFLGLAAALLLSSRDRPLAAGAILALVWLKPNLGIVLPAVLVLWAPAQAWRILAAFAAASAAAFLWAWAALGDRLAHWPAELVQHWQAVQGPQPDIASLHSFYYPALTGWPKTAIFAIVLLAGAVYLAQQLRRPRSPRIRALTLLVVWMVELPYVHSFDTILLLPAVALLLGAELQGWADPLVELTLWAFTLLPLAYFAGLHVGFFNGFAAIPVAMLLIAWHRRALWQSRPGLLKAA